MIALIKWDRIPEYESVSGVSSENKLRVRGASSVSSALRPRWRTNSPPERFSGESDACMKPLMDESSSYVGEGGIGFVTSEAAINHTGNPFRRNISYAKSASRKRQLYQFSLDRQHNQGSVCSGRERVAPIPFWYQPTWPERLQCASRLPCLLLHLYEV